MTGAISRDWESCQFPFVLDEKATVVAGGAVGKRSRKARKVFYRAARSTATTSTTSLRPLSPTPMDRCSGSTSVTCFRYMLPMGFPTTGQSIRFDVFGSEGALLIDDDHREQILYTEQGHRNAYAGEQHVNLYFLGSQSAGEWADGKMFGRVAEETRTWLDYLTAGTPCHLSTGKEALVTLAATLAIEEASRTGETVTVVRF